MNYIQQVRNAVLDGSLIKHLEGMKKKLEDRVIIGEDLGEDSVTLLNWYMAYGRKLQKARRIRYRFFESLNPASKRRTAFREAS